MKFYIQDNDGLLEVIGYVTEDTRYKEGQVLINEKLTKMVDNTIKRLETYARLKDACELYNNRTKKEAPTCKNNDICPTKFCEDCNQYAVCNQCAVVEKDKSPINSQETQASVTPVIIYYEGNLYQEIDTPQKDCTIIAGDAYKLITNPTREHYQRAQECWLELHDVKPGDKFRVTRAAKSYELGWGANWEPAMSMVDTIVVDAIYKSEGLRNKHTTSRFPFFVLEPVS